jgi:hypothetical protein
MHYTPAMIGEVSPAIWLPIGVIAFVAILLISRSLFSAESRLRRRRRKNYGHTVSKGKGPMVKLAVNADEAEK